jgi:hypothetical protein
MWDKITPELDQAQDIQISRTLMDNLHPGNCELHAFSDAAPTAYGSAIYIKSGANVSLYIAKTRVKPLKETTIPRMELLAAVTAYRLIKYTQEALNGLISFKKQVIWIDSQIVLHWIKSEKKLPIFVHNRVKELHEFPGDFRYVTSKDNPADLLTRGISAEELKNSTLWWSGPTWLSTGIYPPTPKELGPQEVNVLLQQTDAEEGDNKTDHIPKKSSISNVINAKHFSSYTKLLKVTALVKKCARIWMTKDKVDSKDLCHVEAQEVIDAEKLWIKATQQECYSNEIESLKGKATTSRPTLINQLRLYLDELGLIRLDGRLNNAQIDMDTKFPYLIPKQHTITDLLIRRAHADTLHSGMRSTVTKLRQRYWIPRIREAVNTQLRKCVVCKIASGKPYRKPETPPLQASRIREAPPFTVTGCDFTGALYVIPKGGGTESKVYIALFTCAITRAVHLEVVPDMSTPTFLNAFRRFTARRSIPAKMISDNALTFISTAEYTKSLLNDPEIREYMSNHQVDWSFNPKRAPWWGGFFERLIGLTKMALYKTLRRARITLDQLVTLVTEIGVLNNRPLTYVGETDIAEPLTPAHLLHGRQLTGLPHEVTDWDELSDPNFNDLDQPALAKRTKKMSAIFQQFWQVWSSEYITSLRERHIQAKRGITENTVKIGDIVLVHSDDTKRVNWKLAKIESLIYGNDGIVRAANIKTKNGTTNRPITRLYPLEVTAVETCEPQSQIAQTKMKHNEANLIKGDHNNYANRRSVRNASKIARDKIRQWANVLND